jgi:hypothetical protein
VSVLDGVPWEVESKRNLEALYGKDMYPKPNGDGTFSPGIGHTGGPWPQGTGHDYCWKPWNCISCGCNPTGPCDSHKNVALIAGWTP